MSARQPQVILPVSDLTRSRGFYLDQAGFSHEAGGAGQGDGASATDGAAQQATVMGPGGVPLLLAGPSADLKSLVAVSGAPVARPRAVVYLHRPGLDDLAAELAGRGMAPVGPEVPYPGWRQLSLPDPDGYLLIFWEAPPLSDQEILTLYRTGPERLESAVHGLSDAELDLPWSEGKWTLREVVHHLVDAELSTFQVIRTALALPGRTVTSDTWSPEEWMAGIGASARAVGPALSLLGAQRAWVLEAVGNLPDALSRWVQWPSGYRAEVRTLLRQAGGHAIHHILQIERARRMG